MLVSVLKNYFRRIKFPDVGYSLGFCGIPLKTYHPDDCHNHETR